MYLYFKHLFLSLILSLSLEPPHNNSQPTNPYPKTSQSQCTTSTTLLLSSPNYNDASRNFDCEMGKFRETLTTTTPETTSVTDENGNGGAAATAAAAASPCASPVSPVTPSPRPPFVLQLGRGVSAFMVQKSCIGSLTWRVELSTEYTVKRPLSRYIL